MGELGFLGLKYEEEYGGQGGGYLHDAVLAEELARCGSRRRRRRPRRAHHDRHAPGLEVRHRGPEAALPRAVDHRRRRSPRSAITEPDAGSDVAGLNARRPRRSTAAGSSTARRCSSPTASAPTTSSPPRRRRPRAATAASRFFIVDRDQPGYEASKLEKLGWHASDTALHRAHRRRSCPQENLLGELNGGFKLIMANFQWERLLDGARRGRRGGALLRADAATTPSEREAFGRPIGEFQVIRHKFAEMATLIEAGRALTYHALRLFVDGQDALREVTEAKLFTQRAAFDVADDVPADPRRRGYMVEYGIERAAARRAPRPDRRRHRRDHEGDPRPDDGAVGGPGADDRVCGPRIGSVATPTPGHDTGDGMGVLDGKVAIVTGSARGIGRATAEILSEHGASLVINDLDGDVAAQTASEIGGETAVFARRPDRPERARRAREDRDRRVRQDRHHRQQRRVHARRAGPQDERRLVPEDAGHPRRRAVPRSSARPRPTCASPRRPRRPRASRSSARSSTSPRSPARWATPARRTTRPASPPSSA